MCVTPGARMPLRCKAPVAALQRGIQIHPRQPFDTARFFAAAFADVSLRNIVYSHPGALYLFSLGGLSFNTALSSASLQELRIKPSAPYDILYSIIGHRADIYDCTLPQVRIDSLDWKALLVRHALCIGRIGLREPQLSIYQSKTPRRSPTPCDCLIRISGYRCCGFRLRLAALSLSGCRRRLLGDQW